VKQIAQAGVPRGRRKVSKMLRHYGTVAAFFAATLWGCAVAATPAVATHSAAFVRHPVDTSVYPGISVAVGNVRGITMTMAYGRADLQRRIPLTAQTPMRFASVSKSITAVAVLMLDQAGKIDIDEPVIRYVPQYTSHGSKITVRQLLAMSSGIPGREHKDPILHGDGAITPAQFFRELNVLKLYAKPGTHFDYSNVGYYLLAQLVQNVSGKTFAQYLKQNVFVPARMTRSYSDVGAPDPSLALGYVHRTPSDPFLHCPAPDWSGEIGPGGVISTPADIVRFDIAVMNGTLLDAAHRKEMFTPAIPVAGGVSYGLGWFVYPNGMIQHQGDFTIAQTINALYPDGTFVAEAANAADLGPDFDRTYFATQAQNQYGSKPFPLGTPNPPSLLGLIGPFSTCKQLDKILYGN